MSKSRGNVINPDDVVQAHGADALRLYEMFMGPLEQMKPWQTSGIEGVRAVPRARVERRHGADDATTPATYDRATRELVTRPSRRSRDDIEALRFNTAISAMMILVRHLGALEVACPARRARTLALILSPFAPHLGEELWERLGLARARSRTSRGPRSTRRWCKDDIVEIGVQVNGKVRGAIAARGRRSRVRGARRCASQAQCRDASRGQGRQEGGLRPREDP